MKFIECTTKKQAELELTNCVKIIKADNGYCGFCSMNEYNTWKNQK